MNEEEKIQLLENKMQNALMYGLVANLIVLTKKGKGSSPAGVQMNVTMTRMRKYTSKRRKDRIIKQEAFSPML